MTNSTVSSSSSNQQDQAIWLSLRKAIAKSSGFQRWQQEQSKITDYSLDTQVRLYLEETLETLAY
ncbi:MAG: hypothetical protein Tsb0014_00920 [Pleurocapsa sp.]